MERNSRRRALGRCCCELRSTIDHERLLHVGRDGNRERGAFSGADTRIECDLVGGPFLQQVILYRETFRLAELVREDHGFANIITADADAGIRDAAVIEKVRGVRGQGMQGGLQQLPAALRKRRRAINALTIQIGASAAHSRHAPLGGVPDELIGEPAGVILNMEIGIVAVRPQDKAVTVRDAMHDEGMVDLGNVRQRIVRHHPFHGAQRTISAKPERRHRSRRSRAELHFRIEVRKGGVRIGAHVGVGLGQRGFAGIQPIFRIRDAIGFNRDDILRSIGPERGLRQNLRGNRNAQIGECRVVIQRKRTAAERDLARLDEQVRGRQRQRSCPHFVELPLVDDQGVRKIGRRVFIDCQ